MEPVLGTLGFTKKTGRHFGHPKSRYEVGFPGREFILGNTKVDGFRAVETTLGRLQLLTPTQAVMDRLAAFYAWGDRMSLKQAVLIAQCQPVRLQDIRAWSESQDAMTGYMTFERRVR